MFSPFIFSLSSVRAAKRWIVADAGDRRIKKAAHAMATKRARARLAPRVTWNASAGELSAVADQTVPGDTGSPSRPFGSRRKARLKKVPLSLRASRIYRRCGDLRVVGKTTLKSIERGHRPPGCSGGYKSKRSRVNKKRNCGRSLTPKTGMHRCVADLIKVLNQSHSRFMWNYISWILSNIPSIFCQINL